MLRSIGSTLKTALTAIAHIVAAFALMAMMMVIVANIVGRIFFRSPVTGTLEIVGFAGVIVVAIAVVFTERAHGNVAVDIVVTRLPPGLRRIFRSITYFFELWCRLYSLLGGNRVRRRMVQDGRGHDNVEYPAFSLRIHLGGRSFLPLCRAPETFY